MRKQKIQQSAVDATCDNWRRAGVQADRIRTISYCKEKPFCTEQSKSCWQLNRRAQPSNMASMA
jgi:peptidoglycan-associated lipoprotein